MKKVRGTILVMAVVLGLVLVAASIVAYLKPIWAQSSSSAPPGSGAMPGGPLDPPLSVSTRLEITPIGFVPREDGSCDITVRVTNQDVVAIAVLKSSVTALINRCTVISPDLISVDSSEVPAIQSPPLDADMLRLESGQRADMRIPYRRSRVDAQSGTTEPLRDANIVGTDEVYVIIHDNKQQDTIYRVTIVIDATIKPENVKR